MTALLILLVPVALALFLIWMETLESMVLRRNGPATVESAGAEDDVNDDSVHDLDAVSDEAGEPAPEP